MSIAVLFVDDEADTREFIAASLVRQGFHADTAHNGRPALEQLKARHYDVLVTDIVMPGMGGIALLQACNALPQGEQPLIRIVITSFADKENVKHALNAGADHLLEKPFSSQQLGQLITELYDMAHADMTPQPQADDIVLHIFEQRLASLNLTDKERECVVFILKGVPNNNIAKYCGVHEQSIKNRITRIYRKLGIGSRAQLFNLVFPI